MVSGNYYQEEEKEKDEEEKCIAMPMIKKIFCDAIVKEFDLN